MARPCNDYIRWSDLYTRPPVNRHETVLFERGLCASCSFSRKDHGEDEKMDAETVRDRVLCTMTHTFAAMDPERMMLEYDATWDCERQSDTWYDCSKGTKHPDYTHVKWCRSCVARKVLKEPED